MLEIIGKEMLIESIEHHQSKIIRDLEAIEAEGAASDLEAMMKEEAPE
jgi:hypothetical protein